MIKKEEKNAGIWKVGEKTASMKILQRIWDGFTTFLTIALVAMAIYCTVSVVNQRATGEMFFPFGYRPVVILSGSMEETLQTGGIVIVEKTKEVEEDDIIFFISEDNTFVVHRYVDTDENGGLITKGDNNPKEDLERVTSERLLGKVVVTMNWMAGPMNFFSLLVNKLF